MTALSDTEIQSLRFHLGYGQVSVGAFPYTSDGFQELFTQVIAPNIQDGSETSSVTAVTANTVATIVVTDPAGFAVRGQVFIDVGDDSEIVVVKAISGSNITARFAKAHAASGYPVSTVSGMSRLRRLLYQADLAWQKIQDSSITDVAGLKAVDNGGVEWFESGGVLKDVSTQYRAIVMSISAIVRVQPTWMQSMLSEGVCELY